MASLLTSLSTLPEILMGTRVEINNSWMLFGRALNCFIGNGESTALVALKATKLEYFLFKENKRAHCHPRIWLDRYQKQ
jgi:hypothetical protein